MATNQQDDRRHQNNGQGAVKDAAHDGRLKDNKGTQSQGGGQDDDVQPHGQGRVKDPAHDGRLKDNR
jgi:hypothetical protein